MLFVGTRREAARPARLWNAPGARPKPAPNVGVGGSQEHEDTRVDAIDRRSL